MIDRDFGSMTMISSAAPTFIEFRLDSNRLPSYNPSAPSSVPGIPWRESPDVDGDQFIFPTSLIPAWSVGDNLMDEDDDGIVGIDVQCRYVLEGGILIRDFNFNQSGWGLNRVEIAKGILSLQFEYFAFRSTPGNFMITTDSEGLVNGSAIDGSSFGNGNFLSWDTQKERDRIDLVRVTLGCNPKSPSDTMRTDIAPDFLRVRRGRL